MTQRVVTGTPVNLKERIAALQQRAASASPQSSSSFSASPSAQASLVLPTGASSTGSGSALRERIARFEGKGGVPVPRGSFGLGAPQTRDGAVGRKRGELYGNRIASTGRDSPSSPPSSLSRLGVAGRDFNTDSQRSLSTNEPEVGGGSPVRKRCISTSVLEGFTNGSPRSRAFPSSATSDTVNESEGAETESLSGELNAADSLHVPTRLPRRNSISSADAVRSAIPKDCDSPPYEASDDTHSPPLRSLDSAVLQDVSEEADVPETQTSLLGLDAGESHPKNTLTESDGALGIAAARQDTTGGVDEQRQEQMLEKVQEEQVLEDVVDEDSAKTPVVSSFTVSSIAMSHIYEELATTDGQDIVLDAISDDLAFSDEATPNSGSLSPLTASLEIGERVFHETQKYVVVAPLGPAEEPVTTVLEGDVAPSSASTGNMEGVQSGDHLSEPEAKAETRETFGGRPEVPEINIPLHGAPHSAMSPLSATPSSTRRRHPPSPIPIIRDEHYVEPSLELKTGPKSFHAVVHSKKTQLPIVSLPRAMPSLLDAQVITIRQGAVGRVDLDSPGSPGSPDLSALVAQALSLEQQLLGGESETLSATSLDLASPSDNVTDSGTSQTSQVCLPHSPGVHEALSISADAVPPTPPPKSPHMNALVRNRESSRTSWSWSSEQASSEDSASVTTPPLFEGSEQVHDRTLPHTPAQALNAELSDECEGRQSIGSILSSPGRSARKKVLSMSRPASVLGRMLSRSGRSSSTLALPDDNASIHTCDSETFSTSFATSVSAFPSFSETMTRPSSPNGDPSLLAPFTFPVSMYEDHSNGSRRLSVLSVSTTSAFSANSTLDQELFDAFPAVPSAIPGQGPSSPELKPVRAQEDSPGTPLPPPKLSSKSSFSQAPHPPSSFSFPTLGSESDHSPHGSWSAKSRPEPPTISLPSEQSSPASQSSTGSSIFSSISRSLSGRSRTRVSSSSSTNSKHPRLAF